MYFLYISDDMRFFFLYIYLQNYFEKRLYLIISSVLEILYAMTERNSNQTE